MNSLDELRYRLLNLDTAAVSDAMDSLGICRALHGIKQRVPGHKISGPAYTVQYGPLDAKAEGFKNAGNYIDDVPAGSVIVINNNGDTTCTNWGDILTTVARGKNIAGTVINGSARDISYVKEIGYPLFTRGVYMVSAKNRTEVKATNQPVLIGDIEVVPGDWIFGDENGVLVIPEAQLIEVIQRAENVNATEDRIVAAVKNGVPLAEARKAHGYATPWQKSEVPEDQVLDTPVDFQAYWKSHLDFIDIHYHANPDVYRRRLNALEAGRTYQAVRGGVVLKSHLGDTSAVAATCRDNQLPVFGSTNLNAISGGLNAGVIERALCLHQTGKTSGRLVVDLPTIVDTAHKSKLVRAFSNASAAAFSQKTTPMFDGNGAPVPELIEVLDFCQTQDVVLTTGHATKKETYALLDLCEKKGSIRLLLNQPANPISCFNFADLAGLGKMDWLFVEQTALTYLLGYQDDNDFFSTLAEIPNLIYSSDLGQTTQITPQTWREKSNAWFEKAGISAPRIRSITLDTPLRMLAP